MNEIAFSQAIEKLESIFTNILYLRPEEQLCAPTTAHLTEITNALNDVFAQLDINLICTATIYTLNTDKEYFGIVVNPSLSGIEALTILTTDEPIKFRKYQLELDSRLLDLGFTADELASMILYEISSIMSSESVNKVRDLIDLHVLADDDVIRIRDSANYSQLIIYALKDTLYKVGSLIFKNDIDEITSNYVVTTANLNDSLLSAQDKLINSVYGLSDTIRSPKTIILRWMFMVYKDIKHNSRLIRETLEEAKDFTVSLLKKQEIDKTLSCIERINAQTVLESTEVLPKFIEKKSMYSLNEIGLFKSLKQSGLRKIEDDFYELSIKAKAAETEDDVIFVLRSINSRLSILEDYIYNSNINESEKKKWTKLANDYRSLRDELAKSKVLKKKQYGLFFDYSALDEED